MMRWNSLVLFLGLAFVQKSTVWGQVYRPHPMALLSGRLRTKQAAACDGDILSLQCPGNTSILVQLATYGRHPHTLKENVCPHSSTSTVILPALHGCGSTNAIESVVSECQNKKGCRIKVSPEVVGQDPCPGLGKYLEVAYKCHPTEFRTKVVCQGEKLALDCGPGERIVFLSAFFGRDPKDAPRCPQPRGVHEEACEASYANEFVLGVCKRKRKCILEADSSIFKAPCRPNSKGYLKVASTCVPRDVLLQEFQGDLLEDEMEEESTETWLDEDDKHSRQSLSLSTLGKRPEKGERGSGWSSDVPVPAQEVDLSSVDVGTGTPTTKDPSNDTLSRDPYVALVVDWITAYQFIQANKETFILYLVLSISGGVLLFCSALVLRIMASRGRRKERNEADSEKPLGPGVNGGLLPFPGDSDTENEGGSGDLTFVGDLTSFGVLSPPDDVTLDVVRYTSRGTLRRQDSDTHPRSFSRHLDEHHLYS